MDQFKTDLKVLEIDEEKSDPHWEIYRITMNIYVPYLLCSQILKLILVYLSSAKLISGSLPSTTSRVICKV